MERFFGGSPLSVLVKLLFVSLLVGFVLSWLDVTPRDLLDSGVRFVRSLGDLGFGALRDVGQWIIVGAIIVVPLWLLSRIFASRR